MNHAKKMDQRYGQVIMPGELEASSQVAPLSREDFKGYKVGQSRI
jgi:hypothetical protein